jgi:CRP/FNR family transcriptional regulator, dissimilatory nitrate respiration regulator
MNPGQSLTDPRQTAVISGLRSCRLFEGLSLPDLRELAAITVVKQLGKDDFLFYEGEPARGFFIVQSGTLNVHRLSAAGKEQVIHIFRQGESFAEATLASETGYPANARAVEPSQVLMVRKDGFLAAIRRQPELALRILGSMSLHLRILVGRIEDLTARDVETRLANWLVKRCPNPESQSPVVIELPGTKRALAAELGTVSETFSRTLAKFRQQKLITVSGKKVTLHCPAELHTLLLGHLGETTFRPKTSETVVKEWTCTPKPK